MNKYEFLFHVSYEKMTNGHGIIYKCVEKLVGFSSRRREKV